MGLAHFGFAIAVAGATGAALWQSETTQVMRPGDQATLAGYEFTFTGVSEHRGPNYVATSGGFVVRKDDEPVATLYPERRRYLATGTETTEAAIESGLFADRKSVV